MEYQKLLQIKKHIEEIKNEISQIGSIRPGTIVNFSVKKGKTTSASGGPYHLIVHSQRGKKN